MQIKFNKPLSELNNLLMRNNLQPTPKRSNIVGNYGAKNHKQNQSLINNLSRSPVRSGSRKTINSKQDTSGSYGNNESRNRAKSRKTGSEVSRKCQNHDNIQGAFHITIEGQDLFYCEKCAIKLKNQGFPIKKASQSNQGSVRDHHPKDHQKHFILSGYHHYEGNPQFQVLKNLLSEIYGSEAKISEINDKNCLQDIIEKIGNDLENFYDSLEQAIRLRRQQSRVQLTSLSEHILGKWKHSQLLEANEEIKMMKKDIQQNVESIIGEVQEDTFLQCVENYKERLDSLNKMAQHKQIEIQKFKSRCEKYLQEQVMTIKGQIQRLQSQIMGYSTQKVLNSQMEDLSHFQEGHARGPFRNLFNQDNKDREKSKKRLISRK